MKPCAKRNRRGMLRRGSGNAASAIVSMESRPTSPAPRSSELSSLRSLQLSSSFRGDVHPDSTIVNPCSQRAGRQALLPLNNAGACVYGATSTGISGPVRVIAPAQFRGGRPPLQLQRSFQPRAYRRLTLVHIVNPCSFARSGTGVIRCTRHRAGRLSPHDPVYRPSGRALHPEQGGLSESLIQPSQSGAQRQTAKPSGFAPCQTITKETFL